MEKIIKPDIIFISDGSIYNPIIHSQGIPLLKRNAKLGYKVYLISFEDEKLSPEYLKKIDDKIIFHPILIKKNFWHKILPGSTLNILKGIVKILSIIENTNLVLLHARSFIPSFIAVICKKLLKKNIKIIYDNRGLFIEEMIYQRKLDKNSFSIKLLNRIENLIFFKADSIIVVSNNFKKHLINNYLKVNDLEKKIFVIPNRTDLSKHKFSKKHQFKKKKKFIGVYSGSFSKWQKFDQIIEFIRIASGIYPNLFEFKIYSHDIDILNPEKLFLFSELNVTIKRLSPENVPAYLAQADFGLSFREMHILSEVSSPIKFAEYLANGLPVVVTDRLGDTQEIINKYGVGVIINNTNYEKAIDDLIHLLNIPEIHNKCRKAAEKEFDIEQSYNDYIKIYNSLFTINNNAEITSFNNHH